MLPPSPQILQSNAPTTRELVSFLCVPMVYFYSATDNQEGIMICSASEIHR